MAFRLDVTDNADDPPADDPPAVDLGRVDPWAELRTGLALHNQIVHN